MQINSLGLFINLNPRQQYAKLVKKWQNHDKNNQKGLKKWKNQTKTKPNLVYVQLKSLGLSINLNHYQKYRKPVTIIAKP